MREYNLRINGHNRNINEIIDYIQNYYIRYNDYNILYYHDIDVLSHIIIQMHTDELKEDRHVRYLMDEGSPYNREPVQYERNPLRYR